MINIETFLEKYFKRDDKIIEKDIRYMEVDIKTEDIIKELTKRLKGMCYCRFDKSKKQIEPLKNLIEERWNEPLDVGCIE